MIAEPTFRRSFLRAAVRVLRASLPVLILACTFALPGRAAPSWASEYQLKAAFVYNLFPFIDWPPSSGATKMIVGVAMDGSVPDAFVKFLEGKRVGDRAIEVRQVHSRSEMRACQVLLVAYADPGHIRDALAQLTGTNVLSIGDGEDFARLGGVIAFLPFQNTFHLGVNPRAAERAGLKFRAQLMNIATLLPDERAAP
jgi:hypothetical protein